MAVAVVVGGMSVVDSAIDVDVATIVRVASGGEVSGNPTGDDAADDGAPQALNATSAASRIPGEAFMRGIILHFDRIFGL